MKRRLLESISMNYTLQWSPMRRSILPNGISKVASPTCTSEFQAAFIHSIVSHTLITSQYGFVPFAVLDVSSTGRQTREGSRTLEVGNLPPKHGIVCRSLKCTPSSTLSRTSEFVKLLRFSVKAMTLRNTPIGHW